MSKMPYLCAPVRGQSFYYLLLIWCGIRCNQMEMMKSQSEDESNTKWLWTSQIQHFCLPHQSPPFQSQWSAWCTSTNSAKKMSVAYLHNEHIFRLLKSGLIVMGYYFLSTRNGDCTNLVWKRKKYYDCAKTTPTWKYLFMYFHENVHNRKPLDPNSI